MMGDLLPCDVAFTKFLASVPLQRVLRQNRPELHGVEMQMYRHERYPYTKPERKPHRKLSKEDLAEVRKSDIYRALQMAREMKAEASA